MDKINKRRSRTDRRVANGLLSDHERIEAETRSRRYRFANELKLMSGRECAEYQVADGLNAEIVGTQIKKEGERAAAVEGLARAGSGLSPPRIFVR
ncbi:hypothetical protein Bca4012_037064 [Brassica carinata]